VIIVLALAAIAGGILTAFLLSPYGWLAALFLAPLGGSAAAAVASAGVDEGRADPREAGREAQAFAPPRGLRMTRFWRHYACVEYGEPGWPSWSWRVWNPDEEEVTQ
jgi:hypothetical protein